MSSSSRAPSVARQLWLKWKGLRLPWRRQFLVGADLAGNTFWEFKDALNSNRWRRIVKYSRQTHYADVKISPQWHQWLRHTRDDAPSIHEQQSDVSRQARLKQLAAEADERWRSKPSYLDAPTQQQPVPAIGVNAADGYTPPTEVSVNSTESMVKEQKPAREDPPWKAPQRGAPSENWQPDTWKPGPLQRR